MSRWRAGLRSRFGLAAVVLVLGASGIGTASALAPAKAATGHGRQVRTAPAPRTTARRAKVAAAVLRLDDEFNGPAGAGPNSGLSKALWYTDTCWTSGCSNPPQPTRYAAANAVLDGHGHLVITATRGATGRCGPLACAYTSGRLTMFDWPAGGSPSWWQQYGTFSARIKVSEARDVFPAFFLEGSSVASTGWPAAGEIDIFDGVGATTVGEQQALFGNSEFVATDANDFVLPAGQSLGGWHTYSMSWSPSGIRWSVDGRTTMTMSAAKAGPQWKSCFEHPFSVVLDLAIGSGMSASEAAQVLPARMLVDWVRVAAGT